ncbi:flavohemoglobin expression-modulating QEGLA motif protein [Hahella sp. KA22]|uniref:flavohemoglobin expression-modulating QEGLA motif protein n=1 Tax=Hahella sp. KA22 TaxID=1628392 RepID=UPI000FDDF2EA|nr:flavohemoglobin expression-modulating QEGLA motif protein [Hahella sp. KA22]AZZ91858.1 flavohemoglobin expression-modulating QEGLA motif protein [Hahella sp. KA22]QAY55229.1 flavohemoglobin expression-modulating QEGLA motif protein [Hahella sp. KA22]
MPSNQMGESYLQTLKSLSERIVEAQKPIRILDAIKWSPSIRQQFFDSGFKKAPQVDIEYYQKNCPLGFDPAAKKAEFYEIEREISKKLGQMNPVTQIMRRVCREYQMVVRMLEARGTPEFSYISQELYGSPSDAFHAGDPTLAELGEMMEMTLSNLLKDDSMQESEKNLPAQYVVDELNARLSNFFVGAGIRVMISDGIAADAAAGTDYIKIRNDALFNQQDVDVLEVHEGWVHLGTTLNGGSQPYCTFLSKGPPSATITQEGLAVLSEILTLRSGPTRLFKLINRVRAVTLAEDGATFNDVFHYLCDKGISEDESFTLAARVFRGSTPNLGPFAKDITYIKGFVLTYNFLRLAFARGKIDRLPMLFCGKIVLDDLASLHDLEEQGVITAPRYVPPFFQDLKGLAAWMSFSRFIGQLNFNQLEADYKHLL